MTMIKYAALSLVAMSLAAPISARAQAGPAAPAGPASVASCLAKPAMEMMRDSGCAAAFQAQKMQDWEVAAMASCFGMSPAARTADAACQAIWKKYPQVVRQKA